VISVATTYTANVQLQKPATSDRNWDVPINANAETLDGMTAIGGLAVTTSEIPSATLNVGVSAGNFIRSDGTIVGFAGSSPYAVPASSTVYLWLNDAGDLSSGPSFPTSAHLRLAQVVAGPASILQVVDERIQCSVAGSGLGFVLKAGDTMTGPLSVVSPTTASPLLVADPVNLLIGFFGATPASQAPVLTPLLDGTTGVASDTLADAGPTFSQSVLNDNFASLAAKVDGLIAALKRHGLMGS
jgi:hypothetical protein